MGPPGVGKGTQSNRLAAAFAVPIVASGDMFREIRKQDTPLAAEVRQYMDRGEYVPDDLTIAMVLDRLRAPDTENGYVLDGFPRTVAQAEALDAAFDGTSRAIDHVILLKAPLETVLARLTGRRICSNCGAVYNLSSNPPEVEGQCDVCGGALFQRTDETPQVQRYRLGVFDRQTKPVIAYYKVKGRLEMVDATPPVDAVTEQLLNRVRGSADAK